MIRLRGLVAAAFTPMNDDGTLRLEVVPEVVAHLGAQGVSGVYVCGSTGEGPSLTGDERRAVAEAYAAALDGTLPMVVHVGHDSLGEARALAAHAASIGADAIAAVPPSYFPLESADVVVDCLAVIAQGAPDLPLLYYHVPRLSGVGVDIVSLVDLAAARLPSFGGVKFTDPSIGALQRPAAAHGDRLDMLFGSDEMLLSGLVAGAPGAVGSTYNFLGRLYGVVVDALARGDLAAARHHQTIAVRIIDVILERTPLAALKASMGLGGVDVGPTRLPVRGLDRAGIDALERDLRAEGFFEWTRAS